MTRPVPPGLALTLYDGSADLRAAWLGSRALLTEVRPPVIQLHAYPTAALVPTIDEIRRTLPGVRLWLGLPGNSLVRDGGPKKAAGYVKLCRSWGIEAFVLNCEGPSSAGAAGWTTATTPTLTPAQLDARMRAVLAAVAPELGPMRLGFTSHDMPQWHHLPWAAALGAESPVTLHLPQQYAAPARSSKEPSGPPPATGWKGARARADKSDAEWAKLVAKGTVRADLAPGGDGFVHYGQLHDISAAGVALLLDRTASSAGWTLNARTGQSDRTKRPSCDDQGALAVRALHRARAVVGSEPGSLARYQAQAGLVADGVCGPRTLQALGL